MSSDKPSGAKRPVPLDRLVTAARAIVTEGRFLDNRGDLVVIITHPQWIYLEQALQEFLDYEQESHHHHHQARLD